MPGGEAAQAQASAAAANGIGFFTGRLQGEGRLHVLFRRIKAISVQSSGTLDAGGTLRLVQRIEEEGKAPRTREWRIRQDANGAISGSLTDADGPVTGRAEGRVVRLAFPMDGFQVEQVITIAPDGRTADNVLTVSRFGVAVARLNETIRRLP